MTEDYLWKLFEKTGSIKTYMDYINVRQAGEINEPNKDTGADN